MSIKLITFCCIRVKNDNNKKKNNIVIKMQGR
jgi:hypothetical protein